MDKVLIRLKGPKIIIFSKKMKNIIGKKTVWYLCGFNISLIVRHVLQCFKEKQCEVPPKELCNIHYSCH